VRTLSIILAGLLAAAALAGCGQSEDRDQVRDVAAAFSAALGDGDGAAACEQLSEPTVEALEEQEQAPCEEAIGELRLDADEVAHVRVYVTNAEAEYASGERAYLDRSHDGWRMSAVGCRFEDGKPQSRPATCEVES